MHDDVLMALERTLAEAASDPDAWRLGLDMVSQAVGARGGVVLPIKGRVPGVPMSRSLEDSTMDYFAGGWAAIDGRHAAMPKLIREGLAVDQDFTTPEAMDRHPFWAELLARHDLRWFCGLRVDVGTDAWCLALQRTPGQGPFLGHEQDMLRRLAAPLSRSATLARMVADAKVEGLAEGLDLVSAPAFILDATGQVARINRHADALLRTKGPLAIRGGKLVADGADATALKRHVDAALWSGIRPSSPDLDAVPVRRLAGLPLLVQAYRLRGAICTGFARGRVAVVVTDPDVAAAPAPSVLRRMFDLTESEARLARAAASGVSLPKAALKAGVSYQTARSYMKSILAKTGAQGQTELVSILTRLAGRRTR